jgi:hypothetical protein
LRQNGTGGFYTSWEISAQLKEDLQRDCFKGAGVYAGCALDAGVRIVDGGNVIAHLDEIERAGFDARLTGSAGVGVD